MVDLCFIFQVLVRGEKCLLVLYVADNVKLYLFGCAYALIFLMFYLFKLRYLYFAFVFLSLLMVRCLFLGKRGIVIIIISRHASEAERSRYCNCLGYYSYSSSKILLRL